MKYLITILFVCAFLQGSAQTNFVKNPNLEQYNKCSDGLNDITYCKHWSNIIDTVSTDYYQPEYYNTCENDYTKGYYFIPTNSSFYQYPHSDSGMIGLTLYYDKTSPPPPGPLPFDYRDYAQGRLYKTLTAGQTYCVSFWVNHTEASAYGHNKIGAYLDNGAINALPLPPGSEVTSVTPQVFTNDKITDSAGWTKIEGTFVATGNETHITIGVFAKNEDIDTITTNYWFGSYQYSYYLLDDVSVVPVNLAADAGKDAWVPVGSTVKIGRVGDTTAVGLDCKWYHKGSLIDSGAIISVNASPIINTIDTYVVVQTICGIVKTDTVLVKTVGLSLSPALSNGEGVRVWPNPNNGSFSVTCPPSLVGMTAWVKVYDLLGRVVYQSSFVSETIIKLNTLSGTYIMELKDDDGNVWRERIVVE